MEARNRDFKRKRDIRRLLELVEGEADAPLMYYVVDAICDKLSLPAPSVRTVVQRLAELGFEACLTHFHSRGFRTNAPLETIKEAVVERATR
jgi:tRNA G26 N,N-dimethylase Trm1